MANILLIHIGISKTGTSALQAFLHGNMKKLEEYGWCYPELSREIAGVPFAAFGKEINGSVFYKEREILDIKSENWNRAWERVLEHLKTKHVILSDERICVWDTNKFLTAAKEKYDNIKVIIYLRRQDRAIESFWNQRVKNPNGCFQTFEEYINADGGAECERYHYKKQLDDISRIIGKDNLIVRVYERGQLSGASHTTESDFMSSIGIESDWNQWERCAPQNLRLGANYLELKRIFNSAALVENMDAGLALQYMSCFERLSQVFCKGESEKGCFTLEERTKFLQRFEEENEEIAREYLHREDGVLFYENRMDYPQYECQCTPFEEDLIRAFTAVINVQNKELQRLKSFNDTFAQRLLHGSLNGRKILLFGAGYKCRKLLELLKIPVAWIADNDEAKNGKNMCGVNIVSAKSIKDWQDYFVIVTCVETEEIEKQLEGQNLKKEADYVLAKEYFTCY